jgi:predicted metal-dependent hydrolase
MQELAVQIIRSARRRKTIQARRRAGGIEILAPAYLSETELKPHIDKLLSRIKQREARSTLDDRDLERRARRFNRTYFQGKLHWRSIRWVDNQHQRHGSCCSTHGTIRISARLARMPRFVQDYVLVHELAHLLEPNHGARFWALVNRFEKTERARGYLMAVGLENLDCEEGSP